MRYLVLGNSGSRSSDAACFLAPAAKPDSSSQLVELQNPIDNCLLPAAFCLLHSEFYILHSSFSILPYCYFQRILGNYLSIT
ncbi:MAG: hypothetical protein F6K52_06220 [Moorea sp. SIO3H5]|nr:hypothetical protein [Moorena sp. SIO3H5]